MYEITYSIPFDLEYYYSERLSSLGITDFYFEVLSATLLLKIYSDYPEHISVIDKDYLLDIREILESDWKNKWVEDYQGHELTSNIFIWPHGKPPPGGKYRFIIHLDPEDSFGDGHHPTTRLCGLFLEEIISGLVSYNDISFLDIGTGSGVLAIQAALSGLVNIDLFDYDNDSVKKANINIGLNGIEGVRASLADLYTYTTDKKYDIITANLLSKIIEDNIVKLKSLMKPDGFIILSGIGSKWSTNMSDLFKITGFSIIMHENLDGWEGFVLKIDNRL